MSMWKPIETAPKDGRNLILFGRWWSDHQGRMREPLIGQFVSHHARWEFCNGSGWCGIRPTHWMPLPEAPKEETK